MQERWVYKGMEKVITEFITYLHNTKKVSKNTEISYARDLKKMQYFFEEQGMVSIDQISATSLNSYLLYLEHQHFAPATISRSVAAIRAFFQYLYKEHKLSEDPAQDLKPPKVEKKMPEILTVEEVNLLLAQPSEATPKGIRDKAMLELLYATGIRVSELIHLKVTDVNLSVGYILCRENDRERIIPINNTAKKYMKSYLLGVRDIFVENETCDTLFTNCSGHPMSRQGFWKLLKSYASACGIHKDITPHTLRHSFAAHLVQNGADLKSVQEMMGHADISTTQMYLNIGMYKIRDVYVKAHPRS